MMNQLQVHASEIFLWRDVLVEFTSVRVYVTEALCTRPLTNASCSGYLKIKLRSLDLGIAYEKLESYWN